MALLVNPGMIQRCLLGFAAVTLVSWVCWGPLCTTAFAVQSVWCCVQTAPGSPQHPSHRGIVLADMLLGHCSRLCAHWTLGVLNVLVATGTCIDEAKYPLGIPSVVTKEPGVLMLTWCFSTPSEIFRGSSYLRARTNAIIKTAKKIPKQWSGGTENCRMWTSLLQLWKTEGGGEVTRKRN